MNALAKTMLLGLALAMAGGSAASAQTLRDGVEAAWAINPEIASLAARREAIAARRLAAQSWFAGAPAITLSHVTDQIIVNKQQRATEGELSVPLWLPGEGTASEQLVDAELLRTDAQIAEAKLKIAGEVREAVYAAALAEGQVKIADQRVDTARELEADVARRERAGEVAALEHDLIRGEFLDAQAKARERRAELATARTNLLAITGLSIPAASLNEPLTAGQDPDAHPRLQAATRSIQAAQAALRLAADCQPRQSGNWRRRRPQPRHPRDRIRHYDRAAAEGAVCDRCAQRGPARLRPGRCDWRRRPNMPGRAARSRQSLPARATRSPPRRIRPH